jgi:hypothetical protein
VFYEPKLTCTFHRHTDDAHRAVRRSRGGKTHLVDAVFLGFGPSFPARGKCKRLRAQRPDPKTGAAIQKYSAVLPGIQFDAARCKTSLRP